MTKEVDDILFQFNNKVNLSEFIGKYIEITQRGNGFIARCPFHNEKTPSFSISDEKSLFYCFGCGVGGNVFTFLTKYKNISFRESLNLVADYLGITLKDDFKNKVDDKSKIKLLILKEASLYFSEKINKSKKVIDYLKNRLIDEQLIKNFNIGYCGSDDISLANHFLSKGFKIDELIEVGLFINSQKNDGHFSRFKERILFPIYNFKNHIVGFGGRTVVNSKIKYINSPESSIFKKSNNLFGLKQNINFIKESGEIIIVEGYLDVVSLNSYEINNSLATLGTTLSENQILKIWSLVNNPIICFDGDEAGLNAMKKVASKMLKFLKPGKSISFLEIPDNMDPDNYVSNYGKEAFLSLKKNAKPFSEYIWEIILDQKDNMTPEYFALIDEKIQKFSNEINHKNLSHEYFKFLKNKKDEFFWKVRKINKNISRNKENIIVNDNLKKKNDNELILISFLIFCPSYLEDFIEEISNLKLRNSQLQDKKKIFVKNFIENDVLDNDKDNLNFKNLFASDFIEILDKIKDHHFDFLGPEEKRKFIKSLIMNIRLPFLLSERKTIKNSIISISDNEEQKKLIKNYEEITKEINFIKKREI